MVKHLRRQRQALLRRGIVNDQCVLVGRHARNAPLNGER
jgi:hypothetical protein